MVMNRINGAGRYNSSRIETQIPSRAPGKTCIYGEDNYAFIIDSHKFLMRLRSEQPLSTFTAQNKPSGMYMNSSSSNREIACSDSSQVFTSGLRLP